MTFLGYLIGFLLGCVAHVGIQRWAIQRFGGPEARWLVPSHVGAARYLDPFGAVAALLGGVGWGTPLESASHRRAHRGKVIALMLTGPLANAAIGVAATGAFVALADTSGFSGSPPLGEVLRGHLGLSSAGPTLLAGIAVINLWMAVLSLVPLPPLEGGRILFLLAPRTINWQKAEYYLVDRNIGIAIVVLGLILTLGARPAPLTYLVGVIAEPIWQSLITAFGG